MICINMPVPPVSARVYAVKKVHSSVYRLQNIRRSSHSHQIGRLIFRKMRNNRIQNTVHIFMTLSYCKTAYRITVQIKLRDLSCVLHADIFIDSALINTKKHLVMINRIFQRIQPVHFRFTSFQPSCRSRHRMDHILSVRYA